MTDNQFRAPFVSRSRVTDHGDGFQVCEIGKIVIQNNILSVYDETSPSRWAVLAIPLSNVSIKAKRFVSSGRHFGGGRIEFVGNFGRPWDERIILKMETDEYKKLKRTLRCIVMTLSE
jgi:hypothetical protein